MRHIMIPVALVGIAACLDLTGTGGGQPASVVWMEATLSQSVFNLRVLGTAGCGGLESIELDLLNSDDATNVVVRATIEEVDVQCVVSQLLDTTLVIESKLLRSLVTVARGAADGRRYLQVDRSRSQGVKLWFGGRVFTDTLVSGCQLLHVDIQPPVTRTLPAENLSRFGIPPGELIFVQGREPEEGVTCGNAGTGVLIDLVELRPR